ncbi:MAG: ABC transporter substrate-binding protein [Trueperaceae bacterium]
MSRSPRIRTVLIAAILAIAGTSVAQTGGEIFRAAMQTNPPTLDVMTSTAFATRQTAFYFFESLVAYDEEFDVVPMLAESWEVNDQNSLYTFHLREGVNFHNGDVMEAADVVASFERFIEVSPRKSRFARVEEIEAIDDSTVAFHLAAPDATFLAALASPLSYAAIMPAEIIAGQEVGELEVEEMIGTGPYRLVDWQPDRFVKLVRFEEYSVNDSLERTGLGGAKIANFAEIHLVPVTEPSARVAGIQSGEYDYAEALPTTQFTQLQADPGVETYITRPGVWYVLEFNHSNELTGNLTFRRAIQAALDMESVARAMTAGQEDFYRLQPSLFFNEQAQWWNEAGAEAYNQADVEKARALLEESGYAGEEIVLLTNRDYDSMYKAVLAVANQLETNLGMNVSVNVLDWPGQRAFEKNKEGWHITPTFYSLRFDPSDFESSFHSSAGRKFYNNPVMDAAMERGAAGATLEERQAAYEEAQRIFYDDVTALKLADVFDLEAVRTEYVGFQSWYTPRFWGVEAE